jgi:hypothetical protein
LKIKQPSSLRNILTIFIFHLFLTNSNAQFAPQVGEEGTTAISATDENIINWAKTCTVNRGLLDIAEPDGAVAGAGSADSVMGESNGLTVSLGDGGTATLIFDPPIRDGNGFDFAVFENGFTSPEGDFLELGFVEVSSNGEEYVRFPATSLTSDSTQVGSFGTIDPTQINNLAGKYYSGYGTPFDLSELEDNSDLDVQNITHIRIVDVVGIIEDEYASFDIDDNKVNDPYPTAFPSGGFDLDAIAVLNEVGSVSVIESIGNEAVIVFPNPVKPGERLFLIFENEPLYTAILRDVNGGNIGVFKNGRLQLLELAKGVYFVEIRMNEKQVFKRIVII